MSDPAYRNYWERKRLRAGPLPHFARRWWWDSEGLCDIERVYFSAIEHAATVLDVGAGDLRVRDKLVAAGYAGTYHTQDIGGEFRHTYADLAEVDRAYDAILCLDVIEHLILSDGLSMLERLVALLAPGGTLVVQTPNARCVRQPLSWDMTHLHCYNLEDLWAWFTARGLQATGYRVVFVPARRPLWWRVRHTASAFVITRLLGADYADNIALVVRKPGAAA